MDVTEDAPGLEGKTGSCPDLAFHVRTALPHDDTRCPEGRQEQHGELATGVLDHRTRAARASVPAKSDLLLEQEAPVDVVRVDQHRRILTHPLRDRVSTREGSEQNDGENAPRPPDACHLPFSFTTRPVRTTFATTFPAAHRY